jgi:hypothetical protein
MSDMEVRLGLYGRVALSILANGVSILAHGEQWLFRTSACRPG